MIATVRHPLEKAWAVAVALFGTALISSCAAPAPTPPAPSPRPVASPSATPLPTPAPAFQGDWRDAPQTPGTWNWSMVGGKSTAQFGRPGFNPVARIICDRAGGRVLIMAAGNASGAVPMAVRTTFTARPIASDPALGTPGWLGFALPARDPLLDAIAFSRGRFTLEAAGLQTLYLPSWPELSRVIEDCR